MPSSDRSSSATDSHLHELTSSCRLLHDIKVHPRILLLAHTGRVGSATYSLCTTLYAVASCPALSRVLRAALATPAPRHAARIASGYHTPSKAAVSVTVPSGVYSTTKCAASGVAGQLIRRCPSSVAVCRRCSSEASGFVSKSAGISAVFRYRSCTTPARC